METTEDHRKITKLMQFRIPVLVEEHTGTSGSEAQEHETGTHEADKIHVRRDWKLFSSKCNARGNQSGCHYGVPVFTTESKLTNMLSQFPRLENLYRHCLGRDYIAISLGEF